MRLGAHMRRDAAKAPDHGASRLLSPCVGRHLAVSLGLERLELAVAAGHEMPPRLSPGELRRLEELLTDERRRSWLRGRAALARVLDGSGRPRDTASVRFPDRRASLTHSGAWSVAVGLREEVPDLVGIGVDLELRTSARLETARLFLCEPEQRWLAACPAGHRARALIRLWTVKEALFKSDPDNDQVGLADYRVADPAAARGEARRTGPGTRKRFRYCTVEAPGLALTLALCLMPRRDHARAEPERTLAA